MKIRKIEERMPRKGLYQTDVCRLWWCDNPHYAKGLCAKHYQNLRRFGTPVSRNDVDMLRVLSGVGDFLESVKRLVHSDSPYQKLPDGGVQCIFCGAIGLSRDSLIHNVNCPLAEVEEEMSLVEMPEGYVLDGDPRDPTS